MDAGNGLSRLAETRRRSPDRQKRPTKAGSAWAPDPRTSRLLWDFSKTKRGNDMGNNELAAKAISIIETILDAGGPNTAQSVMDALCDGQCLSDLSIDDQEAVELAYDMIDKGLYPLPDEEDD